MEEIPNDLVYIGTKTSIHYVLVSDWTMWHINWDGRNFPPIVLANIAVTCLLAPTISTLLHQFLSKTPKCLPHKDNVPSDWDKAFTGQTK